MVATIEDLEIEQNAVWALDLEAYEPMADDPTQPDLARPVDMAGWTAVMTVRVTPLDDPVLVLDVPSGRIVMALGAVQLRLTASETRALLFRMADYDLRLTPPEGDDSSEFWMRGKVRLVQAVTR